MTAPAVMTACGGVHTTGMGWDGIERSLRGLAFAWRLLDFSRKDLSICSMGSLVQCWCGPADRGAGAQRHAAIVSSRRDGPSSTSQAAGYPARFADRPFHQHKPSDKERRLQCRRTRRLAREMTDPAGGPLDRPTHFSPCRAARKSRKWDRSGARRA